MNFLFIDSSSKTFKYSSSIGLYKNIFKGKFELNKGNYLLINNYSISKCFKEIAENKKSDSINIAFYSFLKGIEYGGFLYIKNSNDSVIYSKKGIPFSNITIERKYLEQARILTLIGLHFSYNINLDSTKNSYTIIYNDIYCSSQSHIEDIDTFIVQTQNIKGKIQYKIGDNELEKCNCNKIKNFF